VQIAGLFRPLSMRKPVSQVTALCVHALMLCTQQSTPLKSSMSMTTPVRARSGVAAATTAATTGTTATTSARRGTLQRTPRVEQQLVDKRHVDFVEAKPSTLVTSSDVEQTRTRVALAPVPSWRNAARTLPRSFGSHAPSARARAESTKALDSVYEDIERMQVELLDREAAARAHTVTASAPSSASVKSTQAYMLAAASGARHTCARHRTHNTRQHRQHEHTTTRLKGICSTARRAGGHAARARQRESRAGNAKTRRFAFSFTRCS
jgi:hypothetical protein